MNPIIPALLLPFAAFLLYGIVQYIRAHRNARPSYTVEPPLTWNGSGEALVEDERG